METTDRELGVELFNRTWALLESPGPDPDELLHCAHASAYHCEDDRVLLEADLSNIAV